MQAAIAALHAQAKSFAETDWRQIAGLYAVLARIHPSPIVELNRAAALSMIPTTTGAAKATSLVIPEVKGKIDGISIRVPTPNVSLVELTVEVEKATTIADVNAAFKAASEGALKGILAYEEAELVSTDYIGNPHSSIIDAKCTNVIDGTLVKVSGWYDNEWGYSVRVADLVEIVGELLHGVEKFFR